MDRNEYQAFRCDRSAEREDMKRTVATVAPSLFTIPGFLLASCAFGVGEVIGHVAMVFA